MIHVWQPSALQADTFLVWSETIKKWQSVTGWHGVAQAVNQSYVSAKSSPLASAFDVPTASVLSLNNHLSTSELKHLGEQGQQYLFEDMSLSPVEQLRVRHRSGVTSPKLVAKTNQEFQNDDSNAKPVDSTNTQSAVLYALNQTRITSLQSGAELQGLASLPFSDFVLLPSPELLPPPLRLILLILQPVFLILAAIKPLALSINPHLQLLNPLIHHLL